jgi:hypothetical protein
VLSAFITNDSTAGLLATLAPSGELTINFASILPEIAVAGSYLSVPRLGKVNTFERHFALAVTKPHATSIKDVKVELLAAASDALVFDGAPGEDVQLRSDGTIYVLGTFKRNARCTVNSTPPPTDTVDYRFTINAVDTEGKILTATYTLPGGTPLWRAPDGLSRYGFRDCGGDDWCSKGAYDWIVANKSLLKAIDDISGEHGRNIGHRGHDKGTDIDMYHFYLFPGADPKIAKSNYTQLLARVFDLPKMFSSNPNDAGVGLAANAQVTAWVNQTRAGIDNLASLSSVKLLFYIDGPSNAALPKHWGSTLLRTGQIAVSGKPIDLNLGLWNNSKYRPDINHYSHVHISLDPKHLS